MRWFILFLNISLSAVFLPALAAEGPTVRTISADYFVPGQTWNWKYFADGQLYSTEKYTVLESSPTRVLFQMSTRLPGQDHFVIHHLLEVNPQQCLKARHNPADYRPWSLRLYYLDQGRWTAVDGLNTTAAFEEKFNCNPHILRTFQAKTVFQNMATELGVQEVFQQSRYRQDDSSWYFNLPNYPGVMAYKLMSKPTEKVRYEVRFSLTE